MKTRITICGGGNAAHTLAGLLSSRDDVSLNVYVPFADEVVRWRQGIHEAGGITVNSSGMSVFGCPSLVSNDALETVTGSQIIILALPAFAHETILRQIAPHISTGAWICVLPARGGFDMCIRDVLADRLAEVTIVGFQTLPWACRIELYGKQATILGIKEKVDVSVWPSENALAVTSRLQELMNVPLCTISSFLNLALADTGQIIHPGIMYGLFHDWDGHAFENPIPFYQGVNSEIARLLHDMSNEIQTLCAALEFTYPGIDLSGVHPLGEWLLRSYRLSIADSTTLASSFSTNRSYAGLVAPMKRGNRGFVPDFQARYLSEDVPYNLLVTRGIAQLAQVPTPIIDQVLGWAQSRLGKEYLVDGKLCGSDLGGTRSPQRYGFTELDQLMTRLEYYRQVRN